MYFSDPRLDWYIVYHKVVNIALISPLTNGITLFTMVTMSITLCPHCDEHYDTDTHVEHEEMCKEETEEEKKVWDKSMKSNMDRMFDDSLKQVDELVGMAKKITKRAKILEQLAKDQLKRDGGNK